MPPLLISGIASIASTAIDAWKTAAQNRAASAPVQPGKFESAMNQAMGVNTLAAPSAASSVQQLESQLRNAPEVRSILNAQDPSRPASLQVSGDGRVFLQTPGNAANELTVSQQTRDLARQLNSVLAGSGTSSSLPQFSATMPVAGSSVSLIR